MRIALINDNSQASKNAVIASSLQRVCDKYNYELINMGMFDENDNPITYVEEGLMAAILLNSGAVDFVVTGCGTGEGAMMALNSFPNVYCGLITDATSAYLFSQINAGNAVSLPYAYNFGWGAEITLTNIFDNLFKEKMGGGYPKERAVSEKNNREILKQLKSHTMKDLLASIPDIDKDLIEHIKKNQKFIKIMRKYGNKKYIEVLNIR